MFFLSDNVVKDPAEVAKVEGGLCYPPRKPVMRSFGTVAYPARRHEIARFVASTPHLWLDMVKGQVVVRSAVRAYIPPGGLYVLSPLTFGFGRGHGKQLLKVVVWGRKGGHHAFKEKRRGVTS